MSNRIENNNNCILASSLLEKMRVRIKFCIAIIVIVFISVAYRMFSITFAGYKAERNPDNIQISSENIDKIPFRADILDRNGNIIVTSLPTVNVYAKPSKIKNNEIENLKKYSKDIAKVLDMDANDVFKKLNRRADFIYLKRNIVPKEQYEANKLGLPFIDFEQSEKRVYPGKNLFSHIVGAVSIDNKGVAGIEKQYDEFLKKGTMPLRLSLDIAIQSTIRRILSKGIKDFNAAAGNAILMDINTSEIISMVSLPDYDPNDFNNVKDRALFNRNTLGIYEAGSIFKIFNTSMYLDTGRSVNKIFDTTHPIKIGRRIIRDYIPSKTDLDVTDIMIKSSNLGSARMALEVGGDKQKKFMKKIGFFEPTSIEIPEKAKPLLPNRWNKETQTVIATIAYGYGLSVSPLHIITAASGIVNNGKFKEATLIKNKPRKEKRIVSIRTSKQIRDILRLIVKKGSGKRAYAKGYDVGGKTGSARVSSGGKYNHNELNTSFIAVFPIYNPKYTLLVMLDRPKKKEGDRTNDAGLNAALVAGEIIENIAPQLKIIPKDIEK